MLVVVRIVRSRTLHSAQLVAKLLDSGGSLGAAAGESVGRSVLVALVAHEAILPEALLPERSSDAR